MSSSQIIPGNQLCFDQFERVGQYFLTILKLVETSGFAECLSQNTSIYSQQIEEFYLNGKIVNKEIETKVKGVVISFSPIEIALLLGLPC